MPRFAPIPLHVLAQAQRCRWVCVLCVAHEHSCGRWGVAAWWLVEASDGSSGRRLPKSLNPNPDQNRIQTLPPPSQESREYPCELTGGLSCVSGSIIVGRGGLWTCQNQRQDRQGETIGTAWSQGSALRA